MGTGGTPPRRQEDSVEAGYLVRTRARLALIRGDLDGAFEHAEQTLAIGTRHGERNLMALGLHDKGTVLVHRGQVDEGMALLDEATVAAVSGELEPYTTAVVYCGIIAAARDLGDFARAGDWTEAAKRWCDRQSISGFPGVCRVNRAEVMRLRGSWPEAEEEIHRAVEELHDFHPDVAGLAFYELGELQLRMGDLDAADRAFRDAHALGTDPHPGLALLRLARGEVEAARRGIRRALDDSAGNRLRLARLLPAQVETALAAGAVAEAKAAAEELDEIAEAFHSETMRAWAAAATGAVALAEDDRPTALENLRRSARIRTRSRRRTKRLAPGCCWRRRSTRTATRRAPSSSCGPRTRRRAARRRARRPHRGGGAGTAGPGPPFAPGDLPLHRHRRLDAAPRGDRRRGVADLISWHDRTLRGLFADHGGEEVDHAGDGFFSPSPTRRAPRNARSRSSSRSPTIDGRTASHRGSAPGSTRPRRSREEGATGARASMRRRGSVSSPWPGRSLQARRRRISSRGSREATTDAWS